MNHQITISIQKRNDLVNEYLWCIDSVMEQNRLLMKLAGLDPEDVYQDLALRLIETIGSVRRERETMQRHIKTQLERELTRCIRSSSGIRETACDLRRLMEPRDVEREAPYLEVRIIA